MKTSEIMAKLQAKYSQEKEYLQAVQEVLESIEDVYNQHPEFEKAKIVERLVEPDRIFTFRVTWIDDKGEVQTNLGYRVQFNSAIAISILSENQMLKSCVSARLSCSNSGNASALTRIYLQAT